MASRPKKSPASKARPKPRSRNLQVANGPPRPATRKLKLATTSLRREFRVWRAALPTAFERDTLLTPEWIAESVVQETELFLRANLPEGFAERLAAKAHYLYPRHKHFHKSLNRPGNRGRETLLMFMRHWTAGWLKRERNPLHKRLPHAFGMGARP